MKLSNIFTIVAASLSVAAPMEARAPVLTDVDILQFALTLEHLENAFYKQGLSAWTKENFTDAGFSSKFYENLQYIAFDEQSHVEMLTKALTAAGAEPVVACQYDFGFTDPKSFITIGSVLEGVGSAAYLGAAPSIHSNEYLKVAGAILVAEDIHVGLERNALGLIGPASPYGSALDPTSVYTLAAQFIKSCPSSNMALNLKPFPTLTAVTKSVSCMPGQRIQFSSNPVPCPSMFATFVNGLTVTSVPIDIADNKFTTEIPPGLGGQTYAFLTSKNVTGNFSDTAVVSGPAVIEVQPSAPTIDFNEI